MIWRIGMKMKLNHAEREQWLGETKKTRVPRPAECPVPTSGAQAMDDPKRLKKTLLSLRLRAAAR